MKNMAIDSQSEGIMIDKVGAIITQDKKMLVARNQGKDAFFIPGGRREGRESDEECLRREIMEELGATIKDMRYYKDFVADATGEEGKVRIKSYLCKITKASPGSEVEELLWVDRNNYRDAKLGNVLKLMIPELIKENIL